jgi:murein DD-endopeptidase MepM/ murein hydrolase activator NlpD
MVRALLNWLVMVMAILGAWLLPVGPAWAQGATAGPRAAAYEDVIPDFEGVSFRDLGTVEDSGSINFQGQQRQWTAGTYASDILTLGDVATLNAQALSLGQIHQLTGTPPRDRRLSSFELLQRQTLAHLEATIPYLGDYAVEDVAPVQQLLSEQTGQLSFEQATIAEVLDRNPGLENLQLGETDLGRFSLESIPNLDATPIGDFQGWDEAKISDVPGLDHVALSDFPTGISGLEGIISRIDGVWGTAETDRANTISGSYQAGFAVPCPAEGKLTGFESPYAAPEANDPAACAHIELDDLEDAGRQIQGSFEGKQWISGKYHQVEGGLGPLKWVPSPLGYAAGYEPTGRHPFGAVFKVVVWEPDERSDEISFKLLFRWCAYIPGIGRTCTPYNQFKLPWFDYAVNSLVFVGPLDGQGGSSTAPAPPPGVPTSPLASPTLGPCSGESIGGVNLDRLANAVAKIESQGSGGYEAVGPYVADYGGGRAIGRYQMMTYLPEVKAEVRQVEGGQAWLAKIQRGYQPSAAEVRRYFPEPAQERAYRAEMTQLFERARGQIDPQTGRPFTGDRLIERVGQMWFGGPGAAIDGGGSDQNGVLSLYDYGVEVRENYATGSSAIAGADGACVPPGGEGSGEATGDFANPAPGYALTSDFGRRARPCSGCSAYHPAVDLGTPRGTPVNAADGGEVVYASRAGGYGKTVVIDHGNGYQTRYSHLSAYTVSVGTQVSQGQQIAASGSTGYGTGPHLDFGIYENSGSNFPPKSTAVDPENFINF